MIICIVYVVLLLSMIGWLSWWWNEIWYVRPLKARCSASNAIMPLGHLGFPLLGETLSLLWHFNIVSRPDDFIAFKRRKYGYTEGIYRTHLYGSPSIIACSPSLCKFVLDSSDKFAQEWPTTQVLGTNSLITLNEGQRHGIIKSVIVKSINQPDSLSRIVLQIQPTIVAALQLWSQMPKINAFYQVKKNEEQRHLSDEEVLDNVVSTILVGHISIAYAITWSLQFLANNPHVLLKLREENKAMFKENSNESITYEDISKLKYTNKVAEETIRTANLSAFVFRKATDDIVFKGYLIPKGWSVLVWLRNLHNDPTNFKDPMSFNPDRWETRPKQGTYNPFGGGSRSCAGSALVRVSLALFLHHLSIGYKWELLNPDAKVKYLSHPLPSDGFEISICKV
ncbi:ent-kaurenoic acid oxidase-like isoform X2 [Chenopodium quinoa]|uniref:ent-kaurenoic acid oxidase-like isoform X2 n=1 Tax=Chenopodium quinoa TaxID=63459 RepID=UPI000B792D7C|nr:ent-kaurenoic acid oxidase-like isoform X2 [Chenopodium quinoa]